MVGPDDARMGFALTPTGPQGYTYSSGDQKNGGRNVRITATGTPRVEIDAGREGLGLSGAVTILVNGQPAFQGAVPAKVIRVQVP